MDLIDRDEAIALIRKQGVYGSDHSDSEREENVVAMIDSLPTVETVPVAHLDVEKSEILDILDKMQFFLGQRAGRELWNDKSEDIQEKDLENFNRDIQKIKEYLFNVKPVKRGKWLGDKWWRECSECGNVVSSSKTTNFCAECGADMRTSFK